MRNIFVVFTGAICCFIFPRTLAAQPSSGNRSVNAYHYEIQKNIRVKHGAVVSAHPLASQVGTLILQKGGNAIDAAIATQLALAVVYPEAGNIGGGGFLVGHLKNGKNIAIDYREKAPGKAHRDMYLDANGHANTKLSQEGHLAAGVPGTVAGLLAAHKYGKLPFQLLIEPAIQLAEKGFVITEREAQGLNAHRQDFERLNKVPVAFLKPGGWKAGDTLVQKELAHTLRLIRDKGAAGFYEGPTAQKIAAEMQRGGGIITLNDLKNYRAKERTPVVFPYRGYTVITMPLPSSGGVLLPQMLGMIEKFPIGKWGFLSPQAVQLMTEIERRAYADRAKFLGDADFVKVPVKALTSPHYLAARMQDYQPDRATPSRIVQAGSLRPESEETTHLSVVDESGNAVAVTTTLNGSYGSHVVVAGAGFLLNNEMDDFSVKPGVPNMYGAVGTEANAIAPGKRMLSSMTPTIVLKNGQLFLVVGTPGGTTITTSVFQSIVNVIDFGLSLSDAVNQPKFHHQWLPDVLMVEKDFPAATIEALEKMGYKIQKRGSIGRTDAILRHADGTLEAIGDHRGDDTATGY